MKRILKYFIYPIISILISFQINAQEVIIENSLSEGLIAHYAFTNSSLADQEKNDDIESFGSGFTSDRFAEMNSSLSLAGTGSGQFAFINDPLVDLQGDFTINHWFYLESINTSAFQYTLNSRQDTQGNERGGLDILVDRDSLLNFTFRRRISGNNTTAFARKINQKLVTQKWYMATVSKEGNQLKIYLDNQLIFDESTDFSFENGLFWILGAIVQPAVSRELDGRIDDIRFYNRALSNVEISQLANLDVNNDIVPVPLTIELSGNTIVEDSSIGTEIGILSSTSDIVGETFTYDLSGANASSFSIDNNRLLSAEIFDFETVDSLNVIVTVTAGNGSSLSENLTIKIENSRSDVDLNAGLISRYSFDGGAVTDEIGANDGQNFGAGSGIDRFNRVDSTLSIGGESSDQYVLINDPIVSLENDFTINHWFYLESINTGAFQYTLNSRQDLSGNERGGLDILIDRDSLLNFTFRQRSGANSTTAFQRIVNQKLVTEKWYMATVSKENDHLKIYLNNQLIFSESTDFSFESGLLWVLGAIVQPAVSRELDGRIDDVSFYNRALQDDEVSTLFNNDQNGNFNPAPTAITLSKNYIDENNAVGDVIGVLSSEDENSSVFTYTLSGDDAAAFSVAGNELQAAVAFDFETQNSFDLTITTTDESNGTFSKAFVINVTNVLEAEDLSEGLLHQYSFNRGTIEDQVGNEDGSNFQATFGEDRFNILGRALEIGGDNSDQYALISDPLIALENDFTINHWFYLETINTSAFQYTLNSRQDLAGNERGGLDILIDRDSLLNFTFRRVTGNSTTSYQRIVNQKLVTEQWYMATVSKENDQVKIYLNNQLVFDESTDFSFQSGILWALGAIVQPAVSRELDGRIDDIRFYNRALTNDEVEILYNVDHENIAPVDILLSSITVAENQEIATEVGILSTDDADNSQFVYTLSGVDAASFSIQGNQLLTASVYDFETQNSFEITITTDDQSGGTFDENFTIMVEDINEAPLISNATDLVDISLVEDTPSFTNDLSNDFLDLDAGDNITFAVTVGNSALTPSIVNGVLTVDIAPNYFGETLLTVTATDDGGLSASSSIRVDLTPVNDSPTEVNISNNLLNENNSAGVVVGVLTTSDVDGFDTHTYSIAGNTDFTITDDQLITARTFNFEVEKFVELSITSTDQDGASVTSDITITIIDLNETPSNISLTATSVDENSAEGTVVGLLSTEDVDADDAHTYSVSESSVFSIDGAELVVSEALNFEEESSISVSITSTDAGGNTFARAFMITVNDVDESPTAINLSATSLDENNEVGAVVGLLSSEDEDAAATFTYTLSGADAANFIISENELIAEISFDFESQAEHNISILTTDNSGLTFEKDFVITVNDVEEIITSSKEVAKNVINVYPNPFTDSIFIQSESATSQVSIYEASGKLLTSRQITVDEHLDLSTLDSGVYLIHVSNEKGSFQTRLIKN